MADRLILKWGTLKGYTKESDEFSKALDDFMNLGMQLSCMAQDMTMAHKVALCKVIDACNGTIMNDWAGINMTPVEAKNYVMEY
jgi:hypothetical protein